jgi:hypothetical protein
LGDVAFDFLASIMSSDSLVLSAFFHLVSISDLVC